MAQPTEAASITDHIKQLNDARKQVLANPKLYSSVIKGILPLLGPGSRPELRRWTADFLAETFATPALPAREKEILQPFVLDTLQTIVENPHEDAQVLRSIIQTAASIYPIALRWIIENAYDTITWERMMAVKSRILQIWDTAPRPVQICCIKFAQRVVLAQTSSGGIETRRGDAFDINLDRVPANHSVLDPRTLEAEASGLLDRMLTILQDNSSDALLVDSTLNCLSIIVRTRPGTSSRILNTVLAFNPLKLANSPMTPKDRVLAKSMEKTTRMFLIHLSKRDPHSPMAPRIHQHIERLMRTRNEIFNEAVRKRVFDAQQQEAPEAKRLRAALPVAAVAQPDEIPPLGPPPHTLGDVFSLATFQGLKGFDVSGVPLNLVSRINVSTLVGLDASRLNRAVDAVRGRLNSLATAPPVLNPDTAPLGIDEDDDEYEPDFYAAEDSEQILNKLDSSPTDLKSKAGDSLGLEAFNLPSGPPLTLESAVGLGRTGIGMLFEQMKALEDPAAKKSKAGFNRFASSFGDRDSLVTLLTRLAARAPAGLDDISTKEEGDDSTPAAAALGNYVRELLHAYVVDDFRKRIDVAVAWLCEEWFNDKMQAMRSDDCPMHYEKLTLRLLDGILPYLHPQDKILTRFLAEIPHLTPTILSRVKQMCRDPTVVQLALTSLLYLVMMKPPVKELALDTVQGIWTEYEDARPMAAKYLTKFRSAWLDQATRDSAGASEAAGTTSNGAAALAA